MTPTEGEGRPLRREIHCYSSRLEELLRDGEGRFALIQGDELFGCYATEVEALRAGFERCGTTPFLVRRVARTVERVSVTLPR